MPWLALTKLPSGSTARPLVPESSRKIDTTSASVMVRMRDRGKSPFFMSLKYSAPSIQTGPSTLPKLYILKASFVGGAPLIKVGIAPAGIGLPEKDPAGQRQATAPPPVCPPPVPGAAPVPAPDPPPAPVLPPDPVTPPAVVFPPVADVPPLPERPPVPTPPPDAPPPDPGIPAELLPQAPPSARTASAVSAVSAARGKKDSHPNRD